MDTDDVKTGLPENKTRHNHIHLDTVSAGVDRKAFSVPLNKRGNSARVHILDDSPGSYSSSVKSETDQGFDDEITLDVGDSLVKTDGEADVEDPELGVLAEGLDKRSLRIRQLSDELKRLTTFSKRQTMGRLDRTKTVAAYALKGLKFISKKEEGTTEIALEMRFEDLTKDTNGLLPRSLLWKCIGMNKESKEFAEELFVAVVQRRGWNIGDSINKVQMKEFWDEISDQSFDSRLRIFLDMVDKDADGRITEDEVRKIIMISASANKLSNIDQYTTVIMEELDPHGIGYIMIEKFEELLLQAQTQNAKRENEKLRQKQLTMQRGLIRKLYKDFRYFLQDYWQRCWVIILWLGVLTGLFVWKYIEYKDKAVYKVLGHCVCIAKGSAETLKLNMALILLPVCRNTITWLRNKTNLGVVVPLDDNISFHQVIAVAIAIGVGLHSISHLACDFPRLIHATEEEYEPMQQYFGDQAKNYWHFVKEVVGYTGIIMVVLMLIAFTLATPWLRRGKLKLPPLFKKLTGFNAFWYSHHLFVIVYTLLIVHSINLYLTKEWYKKTTWMYLAVPISLYACERLIRAFRSSVKPVNILRVAVDPGNLVALHMSKPDQGFRYNSGQYIFVNCPAVSPFEWHPFSITSAPGDDYLGVHIKTHGDWTGRLEKVFKKVCHEPLPNSKSRLLRADFQGENRNVARPRVLIDGPYGAPAQEYKKYDIVLLIGLGIGATPMISIVKDIVNNMKTKETEESALENGTTSKQQKNKSGATTENNFKTTRAYFYWVTGQQGSFDWFKEVMNEAAEMDKNGVIEMHNYCTSVYEEDDARSALITMLQTLNHAKHGVDVVAGTRVKSHFAKPNWREVYEHIDLKHTGSKIGVFYCGMPAPAKELKHLAHEFSHKTSTRFDFHKENF